MRGLLEPYSEPTTRFCRCTRSLIGSGDRGVDAAQTDRDERAGGPQAADRLPHRLRAADGVDQPRHTTVRRAPGPGRRRLRSRASTTWVAPTRWASSSLAGSMSIAITGWAPVSAAPMTAARPTPPVPKTASGRPAGRCTAFSTAPTPVITAHAEIGRDLRRHAVRHREHARLGDHHPFGEAGDAHQVVDALIALVQAGGAVHQPVGRRQHPAEAAEHRVARHARLALAAAGPPEQRHPVADRHPAAGRADRRPRRCRRPRGRRRAGSFACRSPVM